MKFPRICRIMSASKPRGKTGRELPGNSVLLAALILAFILLHPLCAAGAGSGTALAAGAAPEFPVIAVISDTHYLSSKLFDDGEAFNRMLSSGDGKDTRHQNALLSALAADLPKPSILIVTGDLSFNGELLSHREFAARLEGLRAAGIRSYVLPGNHDIDNPWARSYIGRNVLKVPSVSAAQFASIYCSCGFSEAVSRDSASLSYAVRPVAGLTLILLDSTIHNGNYKSGAPEAAGYIGETTQKWLAARLDEAHARGDRTIVAAHHNFITHNYMFEEGYTLDNADEVAQLLAAHGQTWTLSGHIHIQSAVRAGDGRHSLTDIATGSFPVNPHNYALIKYDKYRDVFRYDTAMPDVEGWAQKAGIKDPALKGYRLWSADYFGGFARKLSDSFLASGGGGAKMDAVSLESLRSFLAELNIEFFAGLIDGAERKRLLESGGYKFLQSLTPSFLSLYVDSVLGDPPELDNNHLILEAGGSSSPPPDAVPLTP